LSSIVWCLFVAEFGVNTSTVYMNSDYSTKSLIRQPF
jgi:hypothetical protein